MQRPRPRKPRLSRMDAAVDAMAQLGFSERLVRSCVKELLKEYGGNEAWPFIEEYSYKELIEAILRHNEENGRDSVVQPGEQSKPTTESENMLEENAEPLETANTVPESQTDNEPQQIEADPQVKTPTLPQSNDSSSPSPSVGMQPTKRQNRPSYGWIVSEEEEDCPVIAVHETVDGTENIEADRQAKSPNKPSGNNTPSPSPILNNQPSKTRSAPCYGWIDDDDDEEEEEEAFPSNNNDPKQIEAGHQVKSMMITHSISTSSSPLPIKNKQPCKRRHFPCYGWIDNDDGPIEFAYSKPAPGWFSAIPVGKGKEMPPSRPSGERRHKQSRWDQSPTD